MNVPVLINPGGGSAGDDPCGRVRDALARAGILAAIEPVAGRDLAARAAALVDQGAPLVIAAGGDGTMSAVGGALADSGTALGILPLGTLNHFARDLGISADLDAAAAIVAAGHRRTIDVAELNGRVFVNNSAIGLYPLLVADRVVQQERLGRSRRLAMLVASLRTLVRFRQHRLALTVNDRDRATIETPLLFVGNNQYRFAMPHAGERDRLDDGRLSVVVIRRASRRGLAAATFRAFAGRSRPGDMVQLDNVTRLRVASGRPDVDISLDGETLRLPFPLDYRIRPNALWVTVPR